MKITLGLLVVGLCLTAYGCVTPFQAKGFRGGYADMQLSDDTFQVEFHGNGYTNSAVVQSYWLRRCAEVTTNNGFEYFQVLAADGETGTMEWQNPVNCNGTTYGNNTNVQCTGGGTTKFNKHSMSGRIKAYKEKPEAIADIYDARIVLKNFGVVAH